ncbi:ribonuclease P protein component [Pontixanthobacter sp.]|uniref:ribonuclease P protein component n=1 Tax=Pontixanthobacter sp. TaxID=2792078 RepID=UPI003C799FA9
MTSTKPAIITQRRDFLAANQGLRAARPAFVLLASPNGGKGVRFGITVTKRIGNAVVRNRIKRRFRELLRDALPKEGLPDHDHILIGRDAALRRDFAIMRKDLGFALRAVREGNGDAPRAPRPGKRPAHRRNTRR